MTLQTCFYKMMSNQAKQFLFFKEALLSDWPPIALMFEPWNDLRARRAEECRQTDIQELYTFFVFSSEWNVFVWLQSHPGCFKGGGAQHDAWLLTAASHHSIGNYVIMLVYAFNCDSSHVKHVICSWQSMLNPDSNKNTKRNLIYFWGNVAVITHNPLQIRK